MPAPAQPTRRPVAATRLAGPSNARPWSQHRASRVPAMCIVGSSTVPHWSQQCASPVPNNVLRRSQHHVASSADGSSITPRQFQHPASPAPAHDRRICNAWSIVAAPGCRRRSMRTPRPQSAVRISWERSAMTTTVAGHFVDPNSGTRGSTWNL